MSAKRIIPFGDQGLYMEWQQELLPELNREVKAWYRKITSSQLNGIRAIIPAFCSLTLFFDSGLTDFHVLKNQLEELQVENEDHNSSGKLIRIPVCYGGKFGPDLAEVANFHGMSPTDLVELHVQTTFFVYMHGFLPGFAYLGHFPTESPTPRKSSPRTRVPRGSVALAAFQTGIYPTESAGGWQLIGRTPIPVLDPEQSSSLLIQPEDQIRFHAIEETEFDHLQAKVQKARFKWEELYG